MEENISKFNKKFIKIKTMTKIAMKDVSLKQILNILKGFLTIYHFYQKELKLKNALSLFVICMTKTNMLSTEEL